MQQHKGNSPVRRRQASTLLLLRQIEPSAFAAASHFRRAPPRHLGPSNVHTGGDCERPEQRTRRDSALSRAGPSSVSSAYHQPESTGKGIESFREGMPGSVRAGFIMRGNGIGIQLASSGSPTTLSAILTLLRRWEVPPGSGRGWSGSTRWELAKAPLGAQRRFNQAISPSYR